MTSEGDSMLIPPSHRMDLVSEPDFVGLRRLDGTVSVGKHRKRCPWWRPTSVFQQPVTFRATR